MAEPTRISTNPMALTQSMFHILMALVDGEKHGFGILLKVETITNRREQIGPGTLYSSIKRMLQAGLIEQSDERADPDLDDQRRRYYRLTGLGQRTLHLETERLATPAAVVQTKDFLDSAFMGGAG